MTNLEMVRKLFPEFNWVAKEENGSVFLFKNKPQRAKYTWVNHGKNTSILWKGIDLELGFWRSSLTSIRTETPEVVLKPITKWMAMDADGSVSLYEKKPILNTNNQVWGKGEAIVMTTDYIYPEDVDYEDSLRRVKWEKANGS